MNLDEQLKGVSSLLRFAGKHGLGWHVRLEFEGVFYFGKTVEEALANARSKRQYDDNATPTRRRVVEEDPKPARKRASLFE